MFLGEHVAMWHIIAHALTCLLTKLVTRRGARNGFSSRLKTNALHHYHHEVYSRVNSI